MYNSEKENGVSRCLQCGEEITYGREGKKFCSEECKNRFHNKQTNSSRAFRSRIHGALEKNYKALSAFITQGRDSVELLDAENIGFNPSFVTSFHKERSRIELGCYDIRYKMSENKIYAIHKIHNVSVNLHSEHKNRNEYDD